MQQIKSSLYHGSTDAGAAFVRVAEKINGADFTERDDRWQ